MRYGRYSNTDARYSRRRLFEDNEEPVQQGSEDTRFPGSGLLDDLENEGVSNTITAPLKKALAVLYTKQREKTLVTAVLLTILKSSEFSGGKASIIDKLTRVPKLLKAFMSKLFENKMRREQLEYQSRRPSLNEARRRRTSNRNW